MIKQKNKEQTFFCNLLLQQKQIEMQEENEFIKKCTQYKQNNKIISIPLEFAFLPVDIISKEFTKFNNQHQHRIYYLGPRFSNTRALHKKYAYSEGSPLCAGTPHRKINKYQFDAKRISNSYGLQIFDDEYSTHNRKNHLYRFGVYYRAFEGPNPTLDFSQQFIFHGNFQSANLDCVVQFKPLQFDLFLRVDSNTRGHINWFYFSMENSEKLKKVRLNICNLIKAGTLYQQEMQPYVFSKRAFQEKQQSWMQGLGISNMSFTQKPYNYQILKEVASIDPYCLSFDYQFQFEYDQVFFAYCIPYTYSQMIYDVTILPNQFSRIHSLGYSLSGLEIPLLHITNHSIYNSSKRNILITGRIHPGESNGSLVLKGFIEFLCSDNAKAVLIRNECNFYIIPMLNPDGVVLGNNRCSASGRDLNRLFPEANRELFPEIQLLKSFTSNFLCYKQILMYYDFHGHSKKKNTFFYGPAFPLSSPNYLKCRILPRIIQNLNSCFRYYSCIYTISQQKKSTGRATMFETFKIPFTYTIETSIGLYYDNQQFKTCYFNKQEFIRMGGSICDGTATFILALNQYQNFLKERKIYRERKKCRKHSDIRRNHTENNHSPTLLFDSEMNAMLMMGDSKQNEQCLFIKLLNEVKILFVNEKVEKQQNLDNEILSDDNNQIDDFPKQKYGQFCQLIIENKKKNSEKINNIAEIKYQNKKYKRVNKYQKKDEELINKENKINLQQEQLQLFEQINIKIKPKLQSSQEVRNKTQKSPKQSIKSSINKKYYNHCQLNRFFKGNYQNVYQQLQIYDHRNEQKKIFKNNLFQALIQQYHKSNKVKDQIKQIRNTIRMKNKQMKNRVEKYPHYSQIQFPKGDSLQKMHRSQLMKSHKTEIFRKTFIKKKNEINNNNINYEMKTIKNGKKQSIEQQNIKNKKLMVLYRVDDLMSSIEIRAKQMRDSLQCRDQKKLKARRNTLIPTSLFEIKQKISSMKKPSFTNEKKTIEHTQQLKVKTFNKN